MRALLVQSCSTLVVLDVQHCRCCIGWPRDALCFCGGLQDAVGVWPWVAGRLDLVLQLGEPKVLMAAGSSSLALVTRK